MSPVITTPTKQTPTKLLNDINWLNLDEQMKANATRPSVIRVNIDAVRAKNSILQRASSLDALTAEDFSRKEPNRFAYFVSVFY